MWKLEHSAMYVSFAYASSMLPLLDVTWWHVCSVTALLLGSLVPGSRDRTQLALSGVYRPRWQ